MITILHSHAGLIKILYKSETDNQVKIEVTTNQGRSYTHKTVNGIHGSHFFLVVNPGESIRVEYPEGVTIAWRQIQRFESYNVVSLEDKVTVEAEISTVSSPQPHVIGLQSPKDAGIYIQALEESYIQISSTEKLKANLNSTQAEGTSFLLKLCAYEQILLVTTATSFVTVARVEPNQSQSECHE